MGVEMVVVGLACVSQSPEADGLAESSFNILDPRPQAPRHSSMSLCQTGEATICAGSNSAFHGTCQRTFPVCGSRLVIEAAVHTTTCSAPPALITIGAL